MAFTLESTLVGVVIGWALSVATALAKSRQEYRRVVGRALADLLEERRRLLVVLPLTDDRFAAVDVLRKKLIQLGLAQVFDEIDKLRTPFAETIDAVAGVEPLLASDMRRVGRTNVQSILKLGEGYSGASVADVEIEVKHITRVITSLAWRHGGATWWRVRRDLHRRLTYEDLVKGSDAAEGFFSEECDLLKKLVARENGA